MSDFFDDLETQLTAAVSRQAHIPRLRRIWVRRSRALLACLAVLVVATPAVAAVGGFFKTGAPNVYGPISAGAWGGRAVPGESRLLPLRVNDPDGGPPWALRMVRTTRGSTCVQLGRVQNGQLGSLGIDHYWADDGLFHPISVNDYLYDTCGLTDAHGYGFASTEINGERASAGSSYGDRGPGSDYCREPGDGIPARVPVCPVGSQRFAFYGLLGPDAVSVTFRTPTGATMTEQTSGGVGAYLFIVRHDRASCDAYDDHPHTAGSVSCSEGESFADDAVQTGNAITAITYRTGTVCHPQPKAGFTAAYDRFINAYSRVRSAPGAPTGFDPGLYRRLAARYLKGYPRPGTPAFMRAEFPTCPYRGYTAPRLPRVTRAQVATPVNVQTLPARHYCLGRGLNSWIPCDGAVPRGYVRVRTGPAQSLLVQISFTARYPVTSLRSAYEYSVSGGTGGACVGQQGGMSGDATNGDVRRGQHITEQFFVPGGCAARYSGSVRFAQFRTADDGPAPPDLSQGVLVGRFSFQVR